METSANSNFGPTQANMQMPMNGAPANDMKGAADLTRDELDKGQVPRGQEQSGSMAPENRVDQSEDLGSSTAGEDSRNSPNKIQEFMQMNPESADKAGAEHEAAEKDSPERSPLEGLSDSEIEKLFRDYVKKLMDEESGSGGGGESPAGGGASGGGKSSGGGGASGAGAQGGGESSGGAGGAGQGGGGQGESGGGADPHPDGPVQAESLDGKVKFHAESKEEGEKMKETFDKMYEGDKDFKDNVDDVIEKHGEMNVSAKDLEGGNLKGIAEVGGNELALNKDSLQNEEVMAHEILHNTGVGHGPQMEAETQKATDMK